jgi:hypothetical protein
MKMQRADHFRPLFCILCVGATLGRLCSEMQRHTQSEKVCLIANLAGEQRRTNTVRLYIYQQVTKEQNVKMRSALFAYMTYSP